MRNIMKHYIKTMISVMLIAVFSTIAKADNIKISELNWQTGSMIAYICLLYTSPSPRDVEESRMPSSA